MTPVQHTLYGQSLTPNELFKTTIKRLMRDKTAKGRRKIERLQHYAECDLHKFTQLDGFIHVEPDCVMHPDEDGDQLFGGHSEELRRSGPHLAVRILIHDGTSHEDAVRAIGKLLAWFTKDPWLLKDYQDAPTWKDTLTVKEE
jgi:hypothetical protein